MSIEKRIAGTFNSEQEVLYAIEGLKRQGYRETDMMVVAENRSAIPMVTSRTGVMVEADMQVSSLAGVMMDSFFTMMTAGMGGTQANALSSRLIERGLPEFTAKQCEEEINNGKIILLVDTNGVIQYAFEVGEVEVIGDEPCNTWKDPEPSEKAVS